MVNLGTLFGCQFLSAVILCAADGYLLTFVWHRLLVLGVQSLLVAAVVVPTEQRVEPFYVNLREQPIIHGKTVSESNADRKRLANEIANAAQNKVVVTGIEDEVDIKTFTMSNSEKIYTGLIEFVNSEVANLVLGSESMAGGMQSYVGSTKAHQDIFRERIEVYRRYIENIMNEEIVPRLVAMGYIPAGLEFKYSNRIDMNNEDRIKLYELITDKYEVYADEIEKEFGINVGKQLNVMSGIGGTGGVTPGVSHNDRGIMSDEEYYRRYGRQRGSQVANFLLGAKS